MTPITTITAQQATDQNYTLRTAKKVWEVLNDNNAVIGADTIYIGRVLKNPEFPSIFILHDDSEYIPSELGPEYDDINMTLTIYAYAAGGYDSHTGQEDDETAETEVYDLADRIRTALKYNRDMQDEGLWSDLEVIRTSTRTTAGGQGYPTAEAEMTIQLTIPRT